MSIWAPLCTLVPMSLCAHLCTLASMSLCVPFCKLVSMFLYVACVHLYTCLCVLLYVYLLFYTCNHVCVCSLMYTCACVSVYSLVYTCTHVVSVCSLVYVICADMCGFNAWASPFPQVSLVIADILTILNACPLNNIMPASDAETLWWFYHQTKQLLLISPNCTLNVDVL